MQKQFHLSYYISPANCTFISKHSNVQKVQTIYRKQLQKFLITSGVSPERLQYAARLQIATDELTNTKSLTLSN